MHNLFKVILIETRNICTRKCWFCKFGQERQDETSSQMDWETIERIVYNLKDLNYEGRISWFLINEPLLDKRIFEILRFTRKNCPNAFMTLNTNGDLLNGGIYDRLMTARLDALGVSIYDDATLSKIHNMKADGKLVILDMRNPTTGCIENRGGNIKTNTPFFEGDRLRYANKTCAQPLTMMAINVKGQVILCCADMYGDVVMGNVKEERLESIWNGAHFEYYRNHLRTHGRKGLKLCDGCSHNGQASPVYYPLQGRPNSVSDAIVPIRRFISKYWNI
jgi:radical SAM protein with 4Fe4S-binding SPASM domain